MIAYPLTLPLPKVIGHSESFASNFKRSTMIYSKEQVFIGKDTNKFNFSIIVPHHDLDIFEAFFASVYGGVMPFTTTWTITNKDNITAKFINGYTTKNLGGLKFEISANMEVV